jgi:hypothetical protein
MPAIDQPPSADGNPERPTLQRAVGQRGTRARSLAVIVAAVAIVGAGVGSRAPEPRSKVVANADAVASMSVPVVAAHTPLLTPTSTRGVRSPAGLVPTPRTDDASDAPTGMLQLGDDGLIGGVGRQRRPPNDAPAPQEPSWAAGTIRAIVVVDGVERAELIPVGGPNALSAVLRLPAANIEPAAVLRVVQDQRDALPEVLHESVVRSDGIPTPPASPRRCVLVAASRLSVGANGRDGEAPVTFAYRAGVVVTSDARVLVVQLLRTKPLRTNLGEPPATRPLCAATR